MPNFSAALSLDVSQALSSNILGSERIYWSIYKQIDPSGGFVIKPSCDCYRSVTSPLYIAGMSFIFRNTNQNMPRRHADIERIHKTN